MQTGYTYGKEERLKSRKRIALLFQEGKRINASPLLMIYRFHEGLQSPQLQAGVSVKTKQFRKAVDRNRIKRLLREAWRLQKNELRENVADGRRSLDIFLLYTGKALPEYAEIQRCTQEAITKLMERNAHTATP